jgi:cellulose synthase/poly-beta-1,6-N-acetylglucosamine synthase-like glycosyltransferase
MKPLISLLLIIVIGLVALPIAVYCLEIIAAISLSFCQRRSGTKAARGRIGVLVPAHNESATIAPTLADIQRQLFAGDRLIVVADNCTDDTSAKALSAGAEVVERHDPARRGKGYALEFGLRHLRSDPPDVVVVVDADCRVQDCAIELLAKACAATDRPVQGLYLMTAPHGSELKYQVAEFAWRVKNWLRPLGLAALGLPCQLTGTGMAFPWRIICAADLASGSLVEDLKLGLDLASMGYPPMFCPSASVTSQFPLSMKGADTQRARWEHGHILTIVRAAPHLLSRAIARRDHELLALALDLVVPPLSLLTMLLIGMLGISALAALVGLSSVPLMVSGLSIFALWLAIFLAWLRCGRDVLPPRAILSVVPHLFGKFRVYRRILASGNGVQWIRTDRGKSSN